MVDMFYRILKAVDSEVVDREIPHTAIEAERNTMIKDAMRETAVVDLVENWYQTILRFESQRPDIVCMCHEVIGAYISWIDISLIANDRFCSAVPSTNAGCGKVLSTCVHGGDGNRRNEE